MFGYLIPWPELIHFPKKGKVYAHIYIYFFFYFFFLIEVFILKSDCLSHFVEEAGTE